MKLEILRINRFIRNNNVMKKKKGNFSYSLLLNKFSSFLKYKKRVLIK